MVVDIKAIFDQFVGSVRVVDLDSGKGHRLGRGSLVWGLDPPH